MIIFGHENVFPAGNGSLARALKSISERKRQKHSKPLDIDRASPYRSYLALYLWQMLDSGELELISQ